MDTYCTKSELINEYIPIKVGVVATYQDAILMCMINPLGMDGTFIYVLN